MMRTLILFLLIACSSQKEIMKKHVVEGSCESQIKSIHLSKGQELLSNVKEVTGKGTSYMVTGLAYSTDVILSFTGGVFGSVVVCSPLIAFDVMASRNGGTGSVSGDCIANVGGEIIQHTNPQLGPLASKNTKGWRCPDLDPIAEGLLRVSACYKEKGETELSKQQLLRMKESKGFHGCLSDKMKQRIQKAFPSTTAE